MNPKFTPTEFITTANQALEYSFSGVLIEGEVASYKTSQNKWVFFDLKDEESSISCFIPIWELRTPIEDGMKKQIPMAYVIKSFFYKYGLDIFEPCGFKNEKPTFRINITDNSATRMFNFPQHLRLKQNNLNLIGFGKGEYYYNLNVNCNKEAIIELFLEKGEKSKISGYIRHVNYSKLNTATKSEIISANYLMQLKNIHYKNDYDKSKIINYAQAIDKINKLCKTNKFGTAVVINNMDTYFDCVKSITEINNYEIFDINNACGENVILFAPNENVNLKDYQNIFVMDSYLCKGYIYSLSTKFNNVYCVESQINMNLFSNLDDSRNTFAKIHNAVKLNDNSKPVPDLITYFNNLKRFNYIDKSIKYNEFIYFVLVMEELGILNFENGILEITNTKSKLENSSIYNFVKELISLE